MNPVLLPPALPETVRSMFGDGYPETRLLLAHGGASLAHIGVGYGIRVLMVVHRGADVDEGQQFLRQAPVVTLTCPNSSQRFPERATGMRAFPGEPRYEG